MRISDWSSDVCSSDLRRNRQAPGRSLPVHRSGRARRGEGMPGRNRSSCECEFASLFGGRFGRRRIGFDRGQRGLAGGLRGEDQPRSENDERSEEHTSELQSLMRISYAVFCLKKKRKTTSKHTK